MVLKKLEKLHNLVKDNILNLERITFEVFSNYFVLILGTFFLCTKAVCAAKFIVNLLLPLHIHLYIPLLLACL